MLQVPNPSEVQQVLTLQVHTDHVRIPIAILHWLYNFKQIIELLAASVFSCKMGIIVLTSDCNP